MNILFWNTYRNRHKQNIDKAILEIVLEKDCDIVILAEYSNNIDELISLINAHCMKYTYVALPDNSGCEKVTGFIKNIYNTVLLQEQSRYKIIKIETTYYQLIIGMIHNLDVRNNSVESQRNELAHFSNDIRDCEDNHSIDNTLLIGDFNANPFEERIIAASTLHAIPYKEEVKSSFRIKDKRKYKKFYNPTWKFLSSCKAPYASFHCNNSDIVNYYWYMFDQIIIRPNLISALDDESLSIIVNTTNHSLISATGKPNKKNYSDHLPIFCTIKEDKIK